MNKELLDEIHNLVKELKEKLVDLEIEENDRNAPDRVQLDPTSEDHYGMFVVARPGQFGNHTVTYVREDLVNCDYYESYLLEKHKSEIYQMAMDDIRNAFIDANDNNFAKEVVKNLFDVIEYQLDRVRNAFIS